MARERDRESERKRWIATERDGGREKKWRKSDGDRERWREREEMERDRRYGERRNGERRNGER